MICVFNLSSSVDKMLRNGTKPPYEKVIVEDNNPIPLFLLGAHAHPLLSFLIKDFSDGGKNSRQKLFGKKFFWCPYNNYELIWYIESPFMNNMDIFANTLPQVLLFLLCNLQLLWLRKQKTSEETFTWRLSLEKRMQLATNSLSNKAVLIEQRATNFRNTLKFPFSLKFDVSLLPKEHHQNYWKFTINSIQICFKTDTVLIQIHASSVSTCLCAVEFYLQMSQPNSFNEKDLMVLFNCRWSRRSVNKLSLIRDLYLFTSEARISKWSK